MFMGHEFAEFLVVVTKIINKISHCGNEFFSIFCGKHDFECDSGNHGKGGSPDEYVCYRYAVEAVGRICNLVSYHSNATEYLKFYI